MKAITCLKQEKRVSKKKPQTLISKEEMIDKATSLYRKVIQIMLLHLQNMKTFETNDEKVNFLIQTIVKYPKRYLKRFGVSKHNKREFSKLIRELNSFEFDL